MGASRATYRLVGDNIVSLGILLGGAGDDLLFLAPAEELGDALKHGEDESLVVRLSRGD